MSCGTLSLLVLLAFVLNQIPFFIFAEIHLTMHVQVQVLVMLL